MKNEKFNFRKLKAHEIECRVGMMKQDGSGCSLLLYKDARCDMNILDESVGPENWQRKHTRENANCIVSVWCEDKKQWIDKEDTGSESMTEKEKGLASDSFKRACFNWGIGRELYTAPFIWINLNTSTETYQKSGKNYLKTKFSVSEIGYDDNGVINKLTIKDDKGVSRLTYNENAGKSNNEPKKENKSTESKELNPEQQDYADKIEKAMKGCDSKSELGILYESLPGQWKVYFKNLKDNLKTKHN